MKTINPEIVTYNVNTNIYTEYKINTKAWKALNLYSSKKLRFE